MAGPAAAAGAKAATSVGGKAAGGKAAGSAASRSGSKKAAKGAAASRSAKAKGGGQGGKGGGSGGSRSIGNFASFRSRRKGGGSGGEPEMFSSGYIKFVGIAGGILLFFLLVIIAPLVIFDAAASSCGAPEEDQAVPIQTNHKMDPEDLSQTQIAIRIYLVGEVMGMTPRQIMAAYSTAYVESNMTNIYGGDSDSRGIYQQRNFSPWTDGGRERNNIVDTTISFFLQLREYDRGQPIGDLAAEVQKPAEEYEYRYALWIDEAHEMYDKIHHLVGTPKGIKKIENLEGVVINGSGLDALTLGAACSGIGAFGPANLKEAVTLYEPRSFKTLPAKVWVGGGTPQQVDTRIWDDAVWAMTTYNLVVTASRETGHKTHGDGTALDIVPASGHGWDDTALRLARDLGWTSECGESGLSKTAGGSCDLVPSIIFIGYNGFPSHGDPDHAGSNAHLHISWYNSCYGCGGGALVPPRDWVKVFPAGQEAEEEEEKKEEKEEREKEKKEKEREEKAEAKKPSKKGAKQKGAKA